MSTNPHHDGKKEPIEFQANNGENCMKINPSDLKIIWGKDSRYWKVPEVGEEGDAELYQVSWLEVTGCVKVTDPKKEYEVGFNISLTPDAFGWSGSPVYILVKRGKSGKFRGSKFPLDNLKEGENDKQVKAPMPEKNKEDDEDSKLIYFGLYEVWRGKWKGGLKIHHAFIKQK
ncbi:hypothetical protein C2S51_014895 [Perilla frutescens var. frutescens]|nr:hypothetical protein C2S51_014895 [Perilla frutescens var. frutescens]